MKQTIEIEVPDGKKAIWKDNKAVFEDIKPELPKTWEEFCQNTYISNKEWYISNIATIQKVHCINKQPVHRDSEKDSNILPTKKAAEQHLALMKLHQLRDCYRQGWIPNWKEGSDKFCIVNNVEYEIITHCKVLKFLSFPTWALAQQFLDNFKDLIEEAGDLI